MVFNKKLLVGFLIIVIILFILFNNIFIQIEQINQNVIYSDFNLYKNITFSNQRAESYSFDLINPVIIFIIIPKSVANDISEISFNGDFDSEIIQSDPIIMFKSKELSPGKKNLQITTPIGNKNQTSITFIFPYLEYTKLSLNEKELLKQTVIEASTKGEQNFSIIQSQKVMQDYANGLKQVELQKQETKKVNFSEKTTMLDLAIKSIKNAVKEYKTIIKESNKYDVNVSLNKTTVNYYPGLDDIILTLKPNINLSEYSLIFSDINENIIWDERTTGKLIKDETYKQSLFMLSYAKPRGIKPGEKIYLSISKYTTNLENQPKLKILYNNSIVEKIELNITGKEELESTPWPTKIELGVTSLMPINQIDTNITYPLELRKIAELGYSMSVPKIEGNPNISGITLGISPGPNGQEPHKLTVKVNYDELVKNNFELPQKIDFNITLKYLFSQTPNPIRVKINVNKPGVILAPSLLKEAADYVSQIKGWEPIIINSLDDNGFRKPINIAKDAKQQLKKYYDNNKFVFLLILGDGGDSSESGMSYAFHDETNGENCGTQPICSTGVCDSDETDNPSKSCFIGESCNSINGIIAQSTLIKSNTEGLIPIAMFSPLDILPQQEPNTNTSSEPIVINNETQHNNNTIIENQHIPETPLDLFNKKGEKNKWVWINESISTKNLPPSNLTERLYESIDAAVLDTFYYAKLSENNDWIDVAVGRIPLNDLNEIVKYFDKEIIYDSPKVSFVVFNDDPEKKVSVLKEMLKEMGTENNYSLPEEQVKSISDSALNREYKNGYCELTDEIYSDTIAVPLLNMTKLHSFSGYFPKIIYPSKKMSYDKFSPNILPIYVSPKINEFNLIAENSTFILIDSHGAPESIYTSSTPENLIPNLYNKNGQIYFVIACSNAAKMGKDLISQGAKGYFGYYRPTLGGLSSFIASNNPNTSIGESLKEVINATTKLHYYNDSSLKGHLWYATYYGDPSLKYPSLEPTTHFENNKLVVNQVTPYDLFKFEDANNYLSCINEHQNNENYWNNNWLIKFVSIDKNISTETFNIFDRKSINLLDSKNINLSKINGIYLYHNSDLISPLDYNKEDNKLTRKIKHAPSNKPLYWLSVIFDYNKQDNTINFVRGEFDLEAIISPCFYQSPLQLLADYDSKYLKNRQGIVRSDGEFNVNFSDVKKVLLKTGNKTMILDSDYFFKNSNELFNYYKLNNSTEYTEYTKHNSNIFYLTLSIETKKFLYDNNALQNGYTIEFETS